MDPVTGLSSRSLRLLMVLVLVGIAAGTVAALGRAAPGCPEERYGCATSHEDEPAVLGILVTRDWERETRAAQELRAIVGAQRRFVGRPLVARTELISCDPAEGAEAARRLATDPLDEAPAFAVIAAACPRVLLPVAQILGDSAVPLVSAGAPGAVPRNARSLVDGSGLAVAGGGLALVLGLVELAKDLAVTHGEDLLIPRIPLIRALRAELEADGSPRR